MNKLAETIHRVGQRAFVRIDAFRSLPDDEAAWSTELRVAFIDAGNAGEFSEWGITDGSQLQTLDYRVGFQEDGEMFIQNLDEIVSHINMIKWHHEAAAGNVAAQSILGHRYLYGGTLPVDYHKAFEFLSLAAKKGASRAIAALAQMYEEGLGIATDMIEAIRLYERAASAGEFFAQIALGRIYATGTSLVSDPELAHKWYSAAAAQEGTVIDGPELQEAKAYLARRS